MRRVDSSQFTVNSPRRKMERLGKRLNGELNTKGTESIEATEKKALGIGHGGRGDSLRLWSECGRLERAAAEWPG
jgi:hypothetical protein